MEESSVHEHQDWAVLALLLRPQGRKGELLADLYTDFPNRFDDRRNIALRKPDGSIQPVTIESHWLPTGRNAGRIVLKLRGIDSIEQAEQFKDIEVVIPAAERITLDEDSTYISDLIGCTLIDEDRIIGAIEDVHFPTTTTGTRLEEAAPLLVVLSPQGDELLIPFAKAWILQLDLPGKCIQMRLPEGLLEING